jgi:quercetin dioxygenase-like cupin family protein
MNLKINRPFILILGISLTFTACNPGDKKEEPAATADSTGNAKTETVTPEIPDTAIDVVQVAPKLYKVLSDTMGIRVMIATYKPRDSSVLHSHPDYAIYVISFGRAEFTGKDGQKNVDDMKFGMTEIKPGEFHGVKNTGKTIMKVLLVEVNRPRGTISRDPAMDAVKIAPARYKSKNDTLGIRVLEVNYKPKDSSLLLAQPDNAIYAIKGGTVEFTERDGTKHTNTLKTGMAMIMPAGVYRVKNTGLKSLNILMVEVYRPVK